MSSRRLSLAAGLVAVLVVFAGLAILLGGTGGGERRTAGIEPRAIPPQRIGDLGAAVRAAGARRIGHDYEFGINEHTDGPVAYPTNPPTNGPHAFNWTRDGVYVGAPAPRTGELVHAQEHGRVVIQYRQGLSRHKLGQLLALYAESPQHVILAENSTGMPCEVAATAWGQGVLCPKLTVASFDALRAFRARFRDRGPETVP